MKNILVVESSPRGSQSFSRKLSAAIVEKLKAKNSGATVTTHDICKNPTPHLEEAHLAAFFTPPENHSSQNKETLKNSDSSINEVMAADAIVISLPMWNFSIPSALKAWIDHLARAGKTFRYTATGPEGLVKGKKVYLAIATGGVYSEGPMKAYDFTEPYLRTVLGFLGMSDVTTFRVEGVANPDNQAGALAKAVASVHI